MHFFKSQFVIALVAAICSLVLGCGNDFLSIVDPDSQIKIYFTIDDAPNQYFESILELLGDNHVTFFMEGAKIEERGLDVAIKALEHGHQIGNHSYSHPFFPTLTAQEAIEEIEKTQVLIDELYDRAGLACPRYVRFPFGAALLDPEFQEFLDSNHYSVIDWDTDSRDWMFGNRHTAGVANIMSNIERVRSNEIILAHDLPITFLYILPAMLQSDKYIFCSLSE